MLMPISTNMFLTMTCFLAGFPCQPFSLAGVSKKKIRWVARMGSSVKLKEHFFFDVARIIRAKKPAIFLCLRTSKT